MNEEQPVQLPHYGPYHADRKEAAPLNKIIGKMIPKGLKPKLLGRAKGVKSDQVVHIKHKEKVKFW